LLIHSDLFALTNLHLFCWRYSALIRAWEPSFAVYCSASVEQRSAVEPVSIASLNTPHPSNLCRLLSFRWRERGQYAAVGNAALPGQPQNHSSGCCAIFPYRKFHSIPPARFRQVVRDSACDPSP
jgi:hypothetical protein